MRTTSIRFLAAAVALSWSATAAAQVGGTLPGSVIVPGADDRTTRVGTRGANFLHIGIGARQQGMAGAAFASSEGPSALFWNPANIVSREGISAFVSYVQLFGNSGITDIAGAVTVPFGQGAFGFGVVQYSSGEIERTTETAPTGNDPLTPGNFQWTGTAFSAHYARNVTDRLTAAVGARYAREGIDFAHNSYFGADVSTRFRTGLYGLSIGASLLNIGNKAQFEGPAIGRAITQPRYNGQPTGRDLPVNFRTRDAQMPTSFNFGILSSVYGDPEALFGANPTHVLNAEFDISDAIDSDVQPSLGVEYGFRKSYFARIGKRFLNQQHAGWNFQDGMSFGAGLRLPAFGRHVSFDYAYVIMGELQHNQVLSFDFGF
ncbi:MAG: PorV/PorQ family protein [Gemmatimonadaceae bacterium]|nr:PorV/PorQ family protein [Gemmatimonadaceae bacterium]MDQ3519696.1 PorV/PorQ family protein [Gemmatimonadota bacterium]